MIALDTTSLSPLFIPNTECHARDGTVIKHAKERMEHLVEQVSKSDDVIVIPTPSLSEMMVRIQPDKIDELLKRLRTSPWFRVESFDAAAAVELALRTARAIAAGDKREGLQADHTKVKFDRQIVSIAMVCGASKIISDDGDVWAICERWEFPVESVKDLPLPPALVPPPLLKILEDEDEETGAEPGSTPV